MNDVLTIDELAGYLKIPKSTLYKLVHDGRIPGKKVGRHWRFAREAIDAWLASGGAGLAHEPGAKADAETGD